ncbi:MAG: DUF2064 domain-containing protein [Actinomycetota bacterium]
MHLTVIAKQPRPGFVKTRLCPPCTPEQAARLAAAALADTLDAVDLVAASLGPTVRPVLLFDGDAGDWARPAYDVVPQRGSGLAERLANAFDELGPGVVVGMETPQAIGALAGAFSALAHGTDLFGPATDGGYWAIGLHRPDRQVFDGVAMSVSNTGLRQLRRLHELGRSVRRLPMARDLDTVDDIVVAAERSSPVGRLGEVARTTLATLDRSG